MICFKAVMSNLLTSMRLRFQDNPLQAGYVEETAIPILGKDRHLDTDTDDLHPN